MPWLVEAGTWRRSVDGNSRSEEREVDSFDDDANKASSSSSRGEESAVVLSLISPSLSPARSSERSGSIARARGSATGIEALPLSGRNSRFSEGAGVEREAPISDFFDFLTRPSLSLFLSAPRFALSPNDLSFPSPVDETALSPPLSLDR